MELSDKDRKLLWARACNCCSYRHDSKICGQPLTVKDQGKNTVLGEECHIIGDKPKSARYIANCVERETYANAILLCPIHHKMVDDNWEVYTADVLRGMKAGHEAAAALLRIAEVMESHKTRNGYVFRPFPAIGHFHLLRKGQ